MATKVSLPLMHPQDISRDFQLPDFTEEEIEVSGNPKDWKLPNVVLPFKRKQVDKRGQVGFFFADTSLDGGKTTAIYQYCSGRIIAVIPTDLFLQVFEEMEVYFSFADL